MKKVIYSVYDIENEEVSLQLEEAIKQAVAGNEKLSAAVSTLQLSWLGERITLFVSDEWSSDARSAFEQVVGEECSRFGARLVSPPIADAYVLGDSQKVSKAPRQVTVGTALTAVITAVILAVLITFSVTTVFIRKDTPQIVTPGAAENRFGALDVLDRLFRSASLYSDENLNDEELVTAVLNAYVATTGDRYARYYTSEEYESLVVDRSGNMCGIGVTVVAGSIILEGEEYETIQIIYVTPDSPAEKAGIRRGDHVYAVSDSENENLVPVGNVGYSVAVDMMRGEEGTDIGLLLLRANEAESDDDNIVYDVIETYATRAQIKTQSVVYSICETDSDVGIVKIMEFDETTAVQLDSALETLKNSGCKYFVLDLRNNGGGMLTSIEDCMTYFLNKGDTIIRVQDKNGTESVSKVMGAGTSGYPHSGSGELDEADVGKYKDLKMILLVNNYTGSAAELFTADFRDYGLGEIVGTKTYGKGTVQNYYPLSRYGVPGVLKLTTKFYYPAKSDGFDGKGIEPDYPIEMNDEVASIHPDLLPDALDNQLQHAIEQIKK
jgi:carboxyl-terminal processing protease